MTYVNLPDRKQHNILYVFSTYVFDRKAMQVALSSKKLFQNFAFSSQRLCYIAHALFELIQFRFMSSPAIRNVLKKVEPTVDLF